MTTQQIKEKAREEFKKLFLNNKICRCCLKENCDYSTTGCPWYQDTLLLNNENTLNTKDKIFIFLDSTIDSAISQAVKEREEEIIEILGKILNSEIMSKLKPLLNNLIKSKNMEERMKCEVCGATSEDVSYRPNAYSQEVNNDSTAYHTVCDKCDYENRMDI